MQCNADILNLYRRVCKDQRLMEASCSLEHDASILEAILAALGIGWQKLPRIANPGGVKRKQNEPNMVGIKRVEEVEALVKEGGRQAQARA